MKLQLPDVTLVMVETRERVLARMAIEGCLAVADFGDVLILTDKPKEFSGLAGMFKCHFVPDWPDKLGWSRAWWFDVPPLVRTSHTLNIQWDSWIWQPEMWNPDFLRYDYIGSPWWYTDGKNVGNGGFSLVSTRLKKYIYDRRGQFPCNTSADDDLLCRTYRAKLEEVGFEWAPERVAHDFAFECCRPSPDSKHFGFHGMFNWPRVLSPDRLEERMKIALASPYIKSNKYMMESFAKNNPDFLGSLYNVNLVPALRL
jgi:hypothetical protein